MPVLPSFECLSMIDVAFRNIDNVMTIKVLQG